MEDTVVRVKRLWETWDVRGLMLTSLSLQILLTLLAPLRKHCTSSFLMLTMWMLYLSADAVALFTIGQISSNGEHVSKTNPPDKKDDLLAFWTPFLLLHLGGPDTITALALEDNELWRRHALQLVSQVAVTVYVFIQTFRRISSRDLMVPAMLMSVNGCIKYLERTFALYYASMENFRLAQRTKPEPGPNYARLMEEYSSAANGSIPAKIQGRDRVTLDSYRASDKRDISNSTMGGPESYQVEDADHDVKITDSPQPQYWYQVQETDDMIQEAYRFHDKFQGLIADAFLSLKDRDESREEFLHKPAPKAFRIIEIELNFIYDVFYTKAFLLQNRQGYIRLVGFATVAVSLVWFWIKDKSNYKDVDIWITFVLLSGAIALDMIATTMFLLSDWCIVVPLWKGKRRILRFCVKRLLSCSKWATNSCRRIWSFSRWSQSIKTYNLLEQCLKDSPAFYFEDKIFVIRQIVEALQGVLIGLLYVRTKPADSQLGDFIHKELRRKAREITENAHQSIQEVCAARGNLVLQQDYLLVSEFLRPWTVDIDYDESLLTWHLATDLCYWTTTTDDNDHEQKMYRKISKDLSDYMSYLILRQQALVSPVVGVSDIRFQDTSAEAKKFMHERLDSWWTDVWEKVQKIMCSAPESNREKEVFKRCCNKILEVKADVRPIIAKGDKSKSVLFDACRLAKQLNKFKEMQWEITAKVWVELLCYAAVRCSPRSHVAELSKGGELITLVWLLMAHLGLAERFRQDRGFGWTKLIIPK